MIRKIAFLIHDSNLDSITMSSISKERRSFIQVQMTKENNTWSYIIKLIFMWAWNQGIKGETTKNIIQTSFSTFEDWWNGPTGSCSSPISLLCFSYSKSACANWKFRKKETRSYKWLKKDNKSNSWNSLSKKQIIMANLEFHWYPVLWQRQHAPWKEVETAYTLPFFYL